MVEKDIYYYHLITGHMSIRALTRLQEQGKIKCSVDDQDAKQKIKGCKQCILVNAKQHSHNKTTQAPPNAVCTGFIVYHGALPRWSC